MSVETEEKSSFFKLGKGGEKRERETITVAYFEPPNQFLSCKLSSVAQNATLSPENQLELVSVPLAKSPMCPKSRFGHKPQTDIGHSQ